MQIDPNGWLAHERHCVSPHFNQRPDRHDISLLVIHNISLPPGQFGGKYIDDLFLGCLNPNDDEFFEEIHQLQVSAHCLINRQGIVTQYVSFNERAWHAGVSSYQSRENCNDFSIGIELEGTDSEPYTEAQYKQLVRLASALIYAYPSLSTEQIVGHCDIAPGRKTDPGPSFNWSRFNKMLSNSLNSQPLNRENDEPN